MILDILVALVLLLAIYKGWSKGVITGVFSLIALVLGVAAALKLSGQLAAYFQEGAESPNPFWPVLSFVIIFLVVVLLVRLLSKLIEKIFKIALLGWLNRILGMLLYGLAYLIVLSTFVWLLDQAHFFPQDWKQGSGTYPWISVIGPNAISSITGWMPWFKDLFMQLEEFLGNLTLPSSL